MKFDIRIAALVCGVALSGSQAVAGPAEDACTALLDARAALVSMIDAKDKAAQDALNAKVQGETAKLDKVLAGMGADAKAAEFKPVWEQFKTTRQNELIPAIYAGKPDEAKKIATGVQAERLGKMKSVMGCK